MSSHETGQCPPEYYTYSILPSSVSWRKVLHMGTRMTFAKDSMVRPGGSTSDLLYYIAKGEVRLTRILADGSEKTIFYLQAGTLFGEVPFFDELPSLSTMLSNSDDCVLYAFTRETVMDHILPRYPELSLALIRTLVRKVRILCNQTVELALEDLPSRICRFLSSQPCVKSDSSDAEYLVPHFNQSELATLLGVHRVSLNKALRYLEKEGIIGPYSKNEVFILNRRRFRELIDHGA